MMLLFLHARSMIRERNEICLFVSFSANQWRCLHDWRRKHSTNPLRERKRKRKKEEREYIQSLLLKYNQLISSLQTFLYQRISNWFNVSILFSGFVFSHRWNILSHFNQLCLFSA